MLDYRAPFCFCNLLVAETAKLLVAGPVAVRNFGNDTRRNSGLFALFVLTMCNAVGSGVAGCTSGSEAGLVINAVNIASKRMSYIAVGFVVFVVLVWAKSDAGPNRIIIAIAIFVSFICSPCTDTVVFRICVVRRNCTPKDAK